MPTCNRCGAEIQFRYVEGRRVPIHPDGGWHCGFRTDAPAASRHTDTASLLREWATHDFCRPTSCPECGSSVYFIHHNGGSVWVDKSE